jgi:hypothetical protein
MNKRPLSITIISWISITVGCIALLSGFLPAFNQNAAQRIAGREANPLIELSLVSGVRMLAVISGVFMLFGFNWARWLLVFWLLLHVFLSLMHSPLELFVHILLLAVVVYFLFRPAASAYFRVEK